jgi:hypothetical protein
METVFSVGSVPRIYNEGPRPAEMTAVEDDWEEMETKELGCEKRLHVCCSYSETGIITVLKSVAQNTTDEDREP